MTNAKLFCNPVAGRGWANRPVPERCRTLHQSGHQSGYQSGGRRPMPEGRRYYTCWSILRGAAR